MASMIEVCCKNCGGKFMARTADRKRGWARFCSKRCKAVRQSRTGGSVSYYRSREYDECHVGMDEDSLQGKF